MLTHTPDYFSRFRCLAGGCPHTCCAGWAVPIDPDTLRLYQTLPAPLGERVRAALTEDGEGNACFALHGDRCPFLNDKNLCEIHLALGEQATGEICRTHPRFFYDFGTLREVGLCGSCPEAARLILENDLRLIASHDDQAPDSEPPLLAPLLTARATAMALLSAEGASAGERLQALLLFANEVQVLIDEEQAEVTEELCAVYEAELPLLDPAALPDRRTALSACLSLLERLILLSPQWRELLHKGQALLAQDTPLPTLDPLTAQRVGQYFLYRHWLRGVWDGDPLSWAELTALGVAVCTLLAPLCDDGFAEVFRLFCQEAEHAQDNLDALQVAFREQLSLAELLSVAAL